MRGAHPALPQNLRLLLLAYKPLFVVYKEIVQASGGTSQPGGPLGDGTADATGGAVAAIGREVHVRSSIGIAQGIGALVSRGELAPGDKLPTVRALAAELGVSTNTVSDAWRILQSHGTVTTDRRRGTTVRARRHEYGPRYWQVPVAPGTIELDLSTGTPDPALLPPVGPVLHRLHADVTVSSYVDRPVLSELEAVIHTRLPYSAPAVTLVDGALDALDRIVTSLVSLGDTVIVEDPTFPPLIDMLELAGARIVSVPLDDEGPKLDALTSLFSGPVEPVAFFTQPRAHNPTGVHTSKRRALAVAKLVKDTSVIVVEDDHSGDACHAPIHSVGGRAPNNTLHIHSFSKSHGPDLRIAAIAGTRELVGHIVRRRQLGPSWTSRLLQQILLSMLEDPETSERVSAAATTYDQRREALRQALASQGIDVPLGAGLNMWVPVADEQQAVVALAAQGIGVAPGSPFCVPGGEAESGTAHIRLSIGTLPDNTEAIASIAERIGRAARGRPTLLGS